jgi:hypothetical protein
MAELAIKDMVSEGSEIAYNYQYVNEHAINEVASGANAIA